jgi:triosephosphate isomerase
LKNKDLEHKRIIIAPNFTCLQTLAASKNLNHLEFASQNIHQEISGAYTGEVSAEMVKSIGVNTTIIGHSERKKYFNESAPILKQKVERAIENNLEVIFCFGELLEDRKSKKYFQIIEDQIRSSLFHLNHEYWNKIILAYEPVWAIGTGETASPDQAQEVHKFVRDLIESRYENEVADQLSILYGGSCKPDNAEEIFNSLDVDGGLIGGASLNADDFVKIIDAL